MEPNPEATLLYPPSVLLTALLRDVSRTFYWTLRILPAAIRQQIGLAYLLARTTDTIADTEVIAVSERLKCLNDLRELISGLDREAMDLSAFIEARNGTEAARPQTVEAGTGAVRPRSAEASIAERVLLQRIPQMLHLLKQFSPHDQQFIRDVLAVITSGQELDLQRFGAVKSGDIVSLAAESDLDDYTYRVAGCVGEFWTRICRAHLFPIAAMDVELLLQRGIRFGQGLQLVNILRDLPRDLRQGRCYLPATRLAAHGFSPVDLLNPGNDTRFRPLYNQYLEKAEGHLAAGWDYTNMLPRRCRRVRLACAWPILIGLRTIAKLRRENVLDPAQKIKVSRKEVKRLMLRAFLALYWPPAWNQLFERNRL